MDTVNKQTKWLSKEKTSVNKQTKWLSKQQVAVGHQRKWTTTVSQIHFLSVCLFARWFLSWCLAKCPVVALFVFHSLHCTCAVDLNNVTFLQFCSSLIAVVNHLLNMCNLWMFFFWLRNVLWRLVFFFFTWRLGNVSFWLHRTFSERSPTVVNLRERSPNVPLTLCVTFP